MKKIFFWAMVIIGLVISENSIAQLWNNSGNNIYNTNTGNVGIGTTNALSKLHIVGDVSPGILVESLNGFAAIHLNGIGGQSTITSGGSLDGLSIKSCPGSNFSIFGSNNYGSWNGDFSIDPYGRARFGDTYSYPVNSSLDVWTPQSRGDGFLSVRRAEFQYQQVGIKIGSGSGSCVLNGDFFEGWTIYQKANLFTTNPGQGHALNFKYNYGTDDYGNIMTISGYYKSLGIGTTNPTAKLTIGGIPGQDGILFPDGTLQTTALPSIGGTLGQTLRHNGTSWVISNLLYNNETNIGIGTTNPTSNLEINSANTTEIKLRGYAPNQSAGVNKSASVLQMLNEANGNKYALIMRMNGQNSQVLHSAYDASANSWREIYFFDFGTQQFEMRNGIINVLFKNTGITSFGSGGGSVGIGTTNPEYGFDVHKPSRFTIPLKVPNPINDDEAVNLGTLSDAISANVFWINADGNFIKPAYSKSVLVAGSNENAIWVAKGPNQNSATFFTDGVIYGTDNLQIDGGVLFSDLSSTNGGTVMATTNGELYLEPNDFYEGVVGWKNNDGSFTHQIWKNGKLVNQKIDNTPCGETEKKNKDYYDKKWEEDYSNAIMSEKEKSNKNTGNNCNIIPNPFETELTIKCEKLPKNEKATVVVQDVSGKFVDSFSFPAGEKIKINNITWPAGIYFFTVMYASGEQRYSAKKGIKM